MEVYDFMWQWMHFKITMNFRLKGINHAMWWEIKTGKLREVAYMREMVQYSINIMRTVTCIVLQHCTSQQNTFGRQSSSVTLTTLHWNYNNGNGENFFYHQFLIHMSILTKISHVVRYSFCSQNFSNSLMYIRPCIIVIVEE